MKKTLVIALAALMLLAGCKKESSEKKILSFSFVSPEVEATINESAKTIVATMPAGTNVTALVPVITVSEKATVYPGSRVPQDFSQPIEYIVCAEDGSQAHYTATVTVEGGGGQTTDPTEISGYIDANTTLPDLGLPVDYIIDGSFYVEGNALLTIEPGVTIMFTGSDGRIIVEENAGLKMEGTADNHIRLVNATNNQNHGAWGYVEVKSSRSDNKFEYVDFINGGSNDNAVVYVDGDAKLSMKNCLIDGSLGNGIVVDGTLTAFENNTITDCEKYPIELRTGVHVNQIGTGNDFTGNDYDMILMNFYWLDHETVKTFTFANHGIPYFMADGMRVDENSIMIVEAGCEFVFPYDKELAVDDGCLIQVNGTASMPVGFRGETNEAGIWKGLRVDTKRATNGGSNLTNCIIEGAGVNEDGALWLEPETRLTISDLTINNSAAYGINLCIPMEWDETTWEYEYDFANYHVTATGLTLSNCALGNIYERNKGVVMNEWPN